MQRGVCGADAHVIVARNFGRFVAGGAAGHSDHGRDLIEVLEAIGEGHTKDYKITDEEKLKRIAGELGVEVEGKSLTQITQDVTEACYSDFGSRKKKSVLSAGFRRKEKKFGVILVSCHAVLTVKSQK